jgi:hypothetical protein
MRGVNSNTRFDHRRDAFRGRFPKVDIRPTQFGFYLNGANFLYKHGREIQPAGKNRVWQWSGLERLKQFVKSHPTGRVLLEAQTKSIPAYFLVPAKKLSDEIKGKRTFSVPADMGPVAERPLSRFIKSHRCDEHQLNEVFAEISATVS